MITEAYFFLFFSLKPYLNRLDETFQIRGHDICLYAEMTRIIPNYHLLLPLI